MASIDKLCLTQVDQTSENDVETRPVSDGPAYFVRQSGVVDTRRAGLLNYAKPADFNTTKPSFEEPCEGMLWKKLDSATCPKDFEVSKGIPPFRPAVGGTAVGMTIAFKGSAVLIAKDLQILPVLFCSR